MRLQASKTAFWVTVPKATVKRKGWKKGTELDWIELYDGNLALKEIKKEA